MVEVVSLSVARARLNAARITHSVARKALVSVPVGSDVELEKAEREAYANVESAREAYEAARARFVPAGQTKPMTCCHAAVDVRGTWYQRETNCVLHGNRTIGTCD